MKAVILCGGLSRRMGTNKALMYWKGKRLAQYGIDLVTALNLPVFLSVKQADRDTFQKVFQGCGIIPDENGLRLEGPARGILSAHLLLPQEDWMVLSCDMPLLTPSMGRDLLRSHGAHPEAEASLFSSQGIYEPLFGIYTSTALGHWLRQDETGAWSSSSMKYLLSRVRVRAIPAEDGQIPFFLNANHPSDLDAGVREVYFLFFLKFKFPWRRFTNRTPVSPGQDFRRDELSQAETLSALKKILRLTSIR